MILDRDNVNLKATHLNTMLTFAVTLGVYSSGSYTFKG